MQGSFVKIQDLIVYVSKYMLNRPKSDLNQLMYADCRLCSDMDKNNAILCKFHSPVSILAKYMRFLCMYLAKILTGEWNLQRIALFLSILPVFAMHF